MHVSIPLSGPYSLRESAEFGFGQRTLDRFDGVLRLGFCLDGTYAPVGVAVRQPAPDRVDLEVVGDADPQAVTRQVARVLSLDADAAAFAALGERDPVLARLLAVAPGLLPPLFHSAYEALAWTLLSARRPAAQMRAVRERLGREHGTVLEVAGEPVAVFPSPEQLLGVEEVPGLTEEKVARLHGLARAALAGDLDVDRLRALDPAEASARLQRLRGVGPFGAMLVVVRALGHTDVLPDDEPQGRAALGELYGLGRPATTEEQVHIAEAWRPYRTWAMVLVRAASGRLVPAGV